MSTAEYPQTVAELHKVWSPNDAIEVAQRAADIPISVLNELADQILAADPAPPPLPAAYIAVQAAFAVAEQIDLTPGELFRMMRENHWPDPIADILADWPAPIICPVVLP